MTRQVSGEPGGNVFIPNDNHVGAEAEYLRHQLRRGWRLGLQQPRKLLRLGIEILDALEHYRVVPHSWRPSVQRWLEQLSGREQLRAIAMFWHFYRKRRLTRAMPVAAG